MSTEINLIGGMLPAACRLCPAKQIVEGKYVCDESNFTEGLLPVMKTRPTNCPTSLRKPSANETITQSLLKSKLGKKTTFF